MKLGINKDYTLKVNKVIDIDIKDYVRYLDGERPSYESIIWYIDDELDFDGSLGINPNYNIETFDVSLNEKEYNEILDKAEEMQYELENKSTSME